MYLWSICICIWRVQRRRPWPATDREGYTHRIDVFSWIVKSPEKVELRISCKAEKIQLLLHLWTMESCKAEKTHHLLRTRRIPTYVSFDKIYWYYLLLLLELLPSLDLFFLSSSLKIVRKCIAILASSLWQYLHHCFPSMWMMRLQFL